MKTWWNFQTGAPQAHHATVVTNQVNATARFSGNAALNINSNALFGNLNVSARFSGNAVLNINPSNSFANLNVSARFPGAGNVIVIGIVRLPSFISLSGSAALNADTLKFLRIAAIATFAASGAEFADATKGTRFAAIATFAGAATLLAVQGGSQLAIANLSGAGSARANTAGPLRAAVASFAGSSSLTGIATQTGRLQAIATFAGVSAAAITAQQRMQVSALLGVSAAVRATPQFRLRGNATFAGAGAINAVSTATGGTVPNAPVITLNSLADDTTPDFLVDLPIGHGDSTDALVGDVLLIEVSANAGASWTLYFSHTLVPVDFTGTVMSGSTTALVSGNYVFRARFQRSASFSAYSPTVSDTIIVPPLAPSFVVTTDATDTTPDFAVTLPSGFGNANDAAVGDVLVFNTSINSGATWQPYFSHTLISADIPAFTVTGTFLTFATYLIRARLERATIPSPWSASVPFTIRIGSFTSADMFLRTISNKPNVPDPKVLTLRPQPGATPTELHLRLATARPTDPKNVYLRAQVDKG